MGDTVELPRWLVVGGGLLLLSTLASSAFLLGRTTAPPPTAPSVITPSVPLTQTTAGTRSSAPAEPIPDASTPTTPSPSSPRAQAGSPERPGPAASVPTSPPSPTSTEAADGVRDYLVRLDRIGGIDSSSVDPNQLVQQAIGGDVSGLDRLIADHKGRQAAIARLNPPPACATHHAKLVQLADQGLSVMQSLRSGIVSGDMQSLMGLQPAAMRLQSLGEEVSRMEATLRASAETN